MDPEELTAQMVAAAEKIIDEMLAKKSKSGDIHLNEKERLAVAARGAFESM